MRHYDLCVIGSGPAGQKAAIQAAKLGKRACVVEQSEAVGGSAINTGTIPSKALREAIVSATGRVGLVQRRRASGWGGGAGTEAADGASRGFSLPEIMEATRHVIRVEVGVVREQLRRNGVELMTGTGRFVDARTVEVVGRHGSERVTADHVLIATGTSPTKPRSMPFDGRNVITSDEMPGLEALPASMIVVGGGVIGTEYASMLTALGVRVTLIEGRSRLLEFVDAEIVEALQYHLRQAGLTLRLGEKVVSLRLVEAEAGARSTDGTLVEVLLESEKSLRADAVMYCVGRQGNTEGLNLAAAGLSADERGRIKVDAKFRTAVEHISAAGDVIGFPALASTSMEQGRRAACAMFGVSCEASGELLPYGIYSIPEISMVGWTEERLTQEQIPYEAGIAQYKEIARGQLLGDETGMLKLLVHQDSHAVLGAHAIGTGATELIHIAQAVMALKGTAEYFVNTVFNYPTLAECYKVAALNALNRLKNV